MKDMNKKFYGDLPNLPDTIVAFAFNSGASSEDKRLEN